MLILNPCVTPSKMPQLLLMLLTQLILSLVLTLTTSPNPAAIIVPMRGREHHLQELKRRYTQFANKHKNNIVIVVAEQDDQEKYNPGKSRNVGFVEAAKLHPSHVIFNDVDTWLDHDQIWEAMIKPPQKNRCHSLCTGNPRVLSGIYAFLVEDYVKTNGFPNDFVGWGYEDNVLYERTVAAKIKPWAYRKGWRLKPGSLCAEDRNHSRDTESLQNLAKQYKEWRTNRTGLSDLGYTITKQAQERLSEFVVVHHLWFRP